MNITEYIKTVRDKRVYPFTVQEDLPMYVIEPLYEGDISPDSEYENGKPDRLVYELDETWSGSLLLAGTDVFIVGGRLLTALQSGEYSGFSLKAAQVLYEGDTPLPEFMQLIPRETLKVNRSEYSPPADRDIYITGSVGEVAVSDRLFEVIKGCMNERVFIFHEIYPKAEKPQTGSGKYKYIIVTACSHPFDLIPGEMKKKARKNGGSYRVKLPEEVEIAAPYLECLRLFDVDVHGYMDIPEPYFLTVTGNDRQSVINVIEAMHDRKFFVGDFEKGFKEWDEFKEAIQAE